MKRILTTCLAFIGLSVLMAQSADIPTGLKMSFKEKFNVTSADWSIANQNYVAKWEANGKKMTAFYTKTEQPTLLRTETEVAMTDLGTTTQSEVTSRFLGQGSNYTFSRAFKVEGVQGAVEGVEFLFSTGQSQKLSVFFDANGSMVRRELY